MKRNTLSAVLMLALTLFMSVTAFAADGTKQWETSKSKTATNLDANYESKVTLSLPAADYKANLDVAFVLDGSTSTDEDELAQQAAELLDELATIQNLNVKASLTIFGGWVPLLEDTGLKELSEPANLDELKTKLTDPSYDKKEGRSGSNLQAGVEAACKHLNEDTAVAAADKYLIILSDGAARMWLEQGEAMSKAYLPETRVFWNSNEDFIQRYLRKELRSFAAVWSAGQSGADIGGYGTTKETADATAAASWDTVLNSEDYYTTYEAATYYAAASIMAAEKEANVILVSYPYHSGETYGIYTEDFKTWLSQNGVSRYDKASAEASAIFSAVKDELIYLVDQGSYVVDEIGQGEGYDFTFVKPEEMVLTVAGDKLNITKVSENVYGFGEKAEGVYPFLVTYYPNGTGEWGECFKWDINQPITVDRTVQLTYTVKLVDPQTAAGIYGQYDQDGSQGYAGLHTNKIAVLYPVDSLGNALEPEAFDRPTVSYKVTEYIDITNKPTDSNPPADDDKTQNTTPDQPENNNPGASVQPGSSNSAPSDDSTLSGNAESNHSVSAENTPSAGEEEATVANGTNPGTGDGSHLALWLVLLLTSAAGLGVLGFKRKKNR